MALEPIAARTIRCTHAQSPRDGGLAKKLVIDVVETFFYERYDYGS